MTPGIPCCLLLSERLERTPCLPLGWAGPPQAPIAQGAREPWAMLVVAAASDCTEMRWSHRSILLAQGGWHGHRCHAYGMILDRAPALLTLF